ncbi:DMT family transporter [Ancylobacter sp.]|uniref:DMT family transporter n=1 Tax=Ancylobacter sp. TaxID=1872567 RepID=UPI003D09836E
MEKPRLAVELALLLLLSTLWGASYSFIKIGVETIPPLSFIAARTALAGGALYVLLAWRGLRLPADRATWRAFLFQACLNSAVPFTLIAWAETHLDAGLAVILNATTPIFAFVMMAAGGRRPTGGALRLVGVACGLVGTGLVVGFEAFNPPAFATPDAMLAPLAILLATACYAGAALFGARFAGLDPMLPACGSLLCGTVLLAPLALVVDRPWTLAPSPASLAALVALALASTAAAFVLYFRLLRTLGPLGATAQAYLRVPIGVGISVVFLGEALAPTAWLGLVAVVIGVAAMTVPAARAARRR